ncbi:MAG: CBS domain-containing protein [Saprospiraceae bacterium]
MMNQEVRKIMTENPVVATPNQSLDDVAQVFLDTNWQQLPVVENNQLIGLVTAFDLWKAQRRGDNVSTVKDIMTTNVVKITPVDKVGTAAELFADRRFKTLPVVNLNNELKGVVTAFDVIRSAFNEEYPQPILYKKEFGG